MKRRVAAQIVSDQRFQQVLTATGNVLYSVDAQTEEFGYLSPAFERLLGYTLQDIRDMGGRLAFMAQVIEGEMFSEQRRIFDELRTQVTTEIPTWVSWWRCKDGSLRCFEDYSLPLYEDGRLIGTDGVLHDITEQRQAEEERERRANQAALIYKVGQRISGELELEALLSEIVTSIRDAFDYFSVSLMLHDEETGRLNMQAVTGGYADILPADLSLVVGQGIIGRVAEIGASVLSDDVTQDPHYVCAAGEHTKSELAVPIKSGKRLIGVLDLQSDQFKDFDETDVMVMETLSDQLAAAIENARLYEAVQQELVERERLQQEVIEVQASALRELSTPIIPIMDRIIIVPLIGSIDILRARDLTRSLLAGIGRHRAQVVILDITGVPLVDSHVAEYLNKSIQAARLKGAQTIITGISDAVAETIVELGIDWSDIETLSDLQTGLHFALNRMGQRIVG